MYIVEIAKTDMRGVLGCLVQLMGSLGILYTFVAGCFLDWKWLSVANAALVLPFSIVMYLACPESPRWLVFKGRQYSASRSLAWLRMRDDQAAIEREIERIKADITKKFRQRFSILLLKDHWKQFLIALAMMFFLNFSGFSAVIYYAATIFQVFPTYRNSLPCAGTAILGVTLLVSSAVAIGLVSKFRRKFILCSSILVMGLAQLAVAFCMAQRNRDAATWLPLLLVMLFLFSGNSGYGTMVWVVAAEIFPPAIRGVGSNVLVCASYLCGFVVAKTFFDLGLVDGDSPDNPSPAFLVYGFVGLAGFAFSLIFVPETKDRTSSEIQELFSEPCGSYVCHAMDCCALSDRCKKRSQPEKV